MDIDQRPAKKRRFFVDGPEDANDHVAPISSVYRSSRPASATSGSNEAQSSQTEAVDVPYSEEESKTSAFDVDTFQTFVGENVEEEVVRALRDASNGDLQRAINMYLDGSWKASVPSRSIKDSSTASKGLGSFFTRADSNDTSANRPESASSHPPKQPKSLKSMPRDRYVGSFGVAAWTTRSGTKPSSTQGSCSDRAI